METSNIPAQTESSQQRKDLIQIQIDRCYLLGGRNSPDDNTLDYLVQEALISWSEIPTNRLVEAVNEAIKDASPHLATIPFVAKKYENSHKGVQVDWND